MPCYDGRCNEKERIVYRDNPMLKTLMERNDILTRMLCDTIQVFIRDLERPGGQYPVKKLSLETQVWYEEHQKFDAKRKAEEERIAKANKKLEINQAFFTRGNK